MDRVVALRNAGTMATCAENRGKMQSDSDLKKDVRSSKYEVGKIADDTAIFEEK